MRLAQCQCGARFDVTAFPPGAQLRCAACRGIFVVPEDAFFPSPPPLPEPPPPPAPTPAAAVSPPAKSPESSFFPAEAQTPRHDWQADPGGGGGKPAPHPPVRQTRWPTQAPLPAGQGRIDPPRARTGGTPPVGARALAAGRGRPGGTPPVGTRGVGGAGTPTGGSRRLGGTPPAGSRGVPPAPEEPTGRRKGSGGHRAHGGRSSPPPALLLAGAGAVALALAAGAWFLLSSTSSPDSKGAGNGSAVVAARTPAEEFATRLARTDLKNFKQLNDLAYWCDLKGLVKERDDLYEKALVLDPKAMAPVFKAALSAKLQLLPVGEAGELWKLVEWCDQHKLADDAERLTDQVLKLNKNHAQANTRVGNVLYEGKYEPKDMVAVLEERRKTFKDEADMLARMSERERRVYKTKKSLVSEFVQDGAPEIEFLDDKPYLLCLQKSKKYAADIRLSDFSEILHHLFGKFYAQYAEKFQLTSMAEEVVVVFVFEDDDAYVKYRESRGFPGRGAAHYELDNKRLMIPNDAAEPYETVFHEGTHQLVHFATLAKGKEAGNMFWFTEGIATYFEAFRRDPKQGFILGEVASSSVGTLKSALRAKALIPLEVLTTQDYGEAKRTARQDPTGMLEGLYYAQSWLLTHYFYNADGGKYRAKFEEYFRKEINGEGGVEAFQAAFGDPKALEGRVLDYLQGLK
ncbi:MAG: DUF1570 domain-containing protein [Planctomycetes bacterium]|nr:DUF1570 domain-containing protein [Planctomycetota bacterium]